MFTSDTQITGCILGSSWQNKDFNLHWRLEIEDLQGRNANIIDTRAHFFTGGGISVFLKGGRT